MQLDERQTDVLKAVFNRIVPETNRPPGWDDSLDVYITDQLEKDLGRRAELLPEVLSALWMECLCIFNVPFETLWTDQQDEMLMRLECDNVRSDWTVPPRKAFALLQTATEKYLRSLGAVIETPDPFTEDDAALALAPRPSSTPPIDETLQTIIDAWPTLPDPLKTGILAMVKSAR